MKQETILRCTWKGDHGLWKMYGFEEIGLLLTRKCQKGTINKHPLELDKNEEEIKIRLGSGGRSIRSYKKHSSLVNESKMNNPQSWIRKGTGAMAI